MLLKQVLNVSRQLISTRISSQCCRNFSTSLTCTSKLDQKSELKTVTEPLAVLKNVEGQLSQSQEGRLFAVIHLMGKQFKVTDGDIILVEGYWPPTISDNIRLDKVLLAGGKDFTLIGTPILQPGLVDIQATIVEKTLSHTKTHFKKKKQKQYMRINFNKSQNTMIRINSIEIKGRTSDMEKPLDLERVY